MDPGRSKKDLRREARQQAKGCRGTTKMPQTGQCLKRGGRQTLAWEVPKLLGLWSSGERILCGWSTKNPEKRAKEWMLESPVLIRAGGSLTDHPRLGRGPFRH